MTRFFTHKRHCRSVIAAMRADRVVVEGSTVPVIDNGVMKNVYGICSNILMDKVNGMPRMIPG